LYWTTERVIEEAIRYCYVLRYSSAESEDGPSGAERTIAHGYEFAASEESAGVILALDIAIADVDPFTTDEVEAVVVVVHAAVYVNCVELDVALLDDANRVIRTLREEDVTDRDILALIK